MPAAIALLAVAVLVVCGGTAPAAGVPSDPSADAPWRWPLGDAGQSEPRVARPFQPPPEPWAAGHRGVDLVGTPGEAVLAPAPGVISHAAPLAGRGVVVIEMGGVRTTFEPVRPVVEVGDRVRTGEVIGHLEATGGHCLPDACLHWGLLRGETYLDPLEQLGPRPADIILLPLSGPPPAVRWPSVEGRPAGPGAAPADSRAATAVAFARQQLGEPYVWAAAGPASWDCSGLTMAAWGAADRSLPHYSAAQYAAKTHLSEGQLEPGDLVFWSVLPGVPSTIFHVGLFIGDGQMIHAPRPGTSVRVESIHSWAQPSFFGRV